MTLLHVTIVAMHNIGICLRGPSGAGKSSLALKLIDRGAVLVADDYAEVMVENGKLIAQSPPSIAGKMEVRGIGIIAFPFIDAHPIDLVIDLLEQHPERMPEITYAKINDVSIRSFSFHKDDLTLVEKVTILANKFEQLDKIGEIERG